MDEVLKKIEELRKALASSFGTISRKTPIGDIYYDMGHVMKKLEEFEYSYRERFCEENKFIF